LWFTGTSKTLLFRTRNNSFVFLYENKKALFPCYFPWYHLNL